MTARTQDSAGWRQSLRFLSRSLVPVVSAGRMVIIRFGARHSVLDPVKYYRPRLNVSEERDFIAYLTAQAERQDT